MKYRIIINGKFADNLRLPGVIERFQNTKEIDVRMSSPDRDKDMQKFAEEIDASYDRVIVVGGDGSLNEVVNGLMNLANPPELAVVPLGTANDLAISAKIPVDVERAFEFAIYNTAFPIDVIHVNDRYFLNAASLGQAAKATQHTPEMLKGVVGKYAYSLSSLISFFDVTRPVPFKYGLDNDDKYIFGYVCNGITCGGGFEVTPDSRINDGKMDVLLIKEFDLIKAAGITLDLWQNNENEYIKRFQTNELKLHFEQDTEVSLDGEVYSANEFHFRCLPKSLKMVIGPESQLVALPKPQNELSNFQSITMAAPCS